MDLQTKVLELNFSKEVKTCTKDTSITEILTIIQQSKIGSIVILEGNKVAGIFTERDFLLKLAHLNNYTELKIKDFMTENPKCINEEALVTDVLELMHQGRFRHVIVTDSDHHLKGIISIKDLMEFLMDTISSLENNMAELIGTMI